MKKREYPAREDIDHEVAWFNQQLDRVQAEFTRLLRELGHTVELEGTSVTNQEEPSGSYQTTRYDIVVDGDLELTLLPYRHTFQNVRKQGWYWYDDSSYRRVAKLNREVVEAILERVQ